MAKIAIKYENITPYGGLFHVMDISFLEENTFFKLVTIGLQCRKHETAT